MPLALSIVASFRGADEPVTVLRFDGVRKRGESYNHPECRTPETDHHRFTFSQGVRDIHATLDFLERTPEFEPSTVILVSFSAASIEARQATARDPRIGGWISVVGAADLQSMMRVISGGVDYAAGLERGVRFGLQDILGIEVDMDHAGLDAFRHQLAYLEDSRREMAEIVVPITWIHGRHDAWMDAERVKDALSRGDTSRRRFIEIPTGHMLKTSREALDAFQLIAGEVGRMALDRQLVPTAPNLVALERRHRAERNRLPKVSVDIRSFWRDYLLGKDRMLGFELMTSITPYENLMDRQVCALDLKEGHRVADLGSGTGAFPLHLARSAYRSMPLAVYEIDYLREGLGRARERLLERGCPPGLDVRYVECDLDVGAAGSAIPLGSESVDAVLAALLVSYVSEPRALLREIHRVLRRRGRLVLSSLRRDADMSKLYTDGLAELRAGRAREIFGHEGEKQLDDAARGYLNEASRLLDLEENGTFQFWDPPELERLVRQAGFRILSTSRSLGNPPQAVVLSAERL
jgi:ubiquinone/menaquinone biosynthesis C-methylase UbiE/pimeloyl-ACP methyl ester carboxylesterase